MDSVPKYGEPGFSGTPVLPYVRPAQPSRRKVKVKDKYGRNTSSVYRRLSAELKASPAGKTCWICGQPIDTTLPTSEYNNPAYFTVDHEPPLDSPEGHLLKGLRPAHKGCNSSRGRQDQLDKSEIEHSRDW